MALSAFSAWLNERRQARIARRDLESEGTDDLMALLDEASSIGRHPK